jgi:glutamate dehydrogenase (NAD(P)+)
VAFGLGTEGFKVLAVSERTGGVYNPKGLDLSKLYQHLEAKKPLREFSQAEAVTNEELLEIECDLLAPCAVANVITEANADKLKCKVLVEGANSPTTPGADDILDGKGVIVIPDILANSAGVTAGYFEWVQGIMHLFWSDAEVYEKLGELVGRACDSVFQVAEQKKTTMRMAAISIAIDRIYEARRLRGLYP